MDIMGTNNVSIKFIGYFVDIGYIIEKHPACDDKPQKLCVVKFH